MPQTIEKTKDFKQENHCAGGGLHLTTQQDTDCV